MTEPQKPTIRDVPSSTEADGHWANYDKYATTLRAWLVPYGIGGPVLFLSNDHLSSLIRKSGSGWWLTSLFLLAVFLQVGNAAVNKWAAHAMYLGELDPKRHAARSYKIWLWVNKRAWIDGIADLAAILMLIAATFGVVWLETGS